MKWGVLFKRFFFEQIVTGDSKRIALFLGFFLLFVITGADLYGHDVNPEIIYTIGGVVGLSIGAETTLSFKRNQNQKKTYDDEIDP